MQSPRFSVDKIAFVASVLVVTVSFAAFAFLLASLPGHPCTRFGYEYHRTIADDIVLCALDTRDDAPVIKSLDQLERQHREESQ